MKIAIIQYPGTNCEYETAEAAKSCGIGAEIFRWNRPSKELAKFDGFICEWVYLSVSSKISPFFSQFSEGEVFSIPIAHQQGRFITSDQTLLNTLKDNRQIALQ
ncbi:MAG: phosphoribosylformylglycinamidine synthase subunit PurQ [bacterium]